MTQIPNDKLAPYKTILVVDDNESDEKQRLIPPSADKQQDFQRIISSYSTPPSEDLYSTNPKCDKYIIYPIIGAISFLIIVIILIFFISKKL